MLEISPSPRPVERAKLDNGLRVVLHPDRSLPLVAINLWYHVGSKNERPGRTGFAHLFEHMLFQGSQNVDTNDHFRLVQQIGGVANGSTAWDRTNYYETLPSHGLDLGLWLESDRLGFLLPAMTEEKFENQRQVVMNERRQRVDNQPYGRAFERLLQMAYPAPHPYNWPIIGHMDDIVAAKLEDVEAFFETYYVPNNAVLTLAGDFDPEAALRRVESFFGSIPAGNEVTPVEAESPTLDRDRRDTLEDRVELPRLYMAFPGPSGKSDEWLASDLLASALTGGKSSPLYQDLVHDRQLAQDVSTAALPTELSGTFLAVATARPGVSIETLEEAVDEHLDRAATDRLGETDLDRARNRTLTAYVDQLQGLDNRADLLSRLTTYHDDPERVDRELEGYLQLDADDLRDHAARHLGRDQRAVLHVIPGDPS